MRGAAALPTTTAILTVEERRRGDERSGSCLACHRPLGAVGPGGLRAGLDDDDLRARVCSARCYHRLSELAWDAVRAVVKR